MNDDIVNRLLNHTFRCKEGDECPNCLLENEAADEIERLREDLLDMTIDRDAWKNLTKLTWEKLGGRDE